MKHIEHDQDGGGAKKLHSSLGLKATSIHPSTTEVCSLSHCVQVVYYAVCCMTIDHDSSDSHLRAIRLHHHTTIDG